MRSEEFDKSQFDIRLQQVLDQRHDPESDARLCEFADGDQDAIAMLRIAELIAAPPVAVVYPTADFADRILAQVRVEDAAELRQRSAPIWKKRTGLYWGAGLVAAASVAMLLSFWNSQPPSNLVAASAVKEAREIEAGPSEGSIAEMPSDEARKVLIEKFAVEQEKVAQLRSGLNPFRSTLNVTLHVIRSTVPTRTPPHPARRPVEGKPSTAVVHPRWVV